MPYKSIISNKEFQHKLESYQKEYKKLVNNNYKLVNFEYTNDGVSSKKTKRVSLYDVLFEAKYDSVLDFFSTKQKL